jgi:parvulin-like peptidyl-prolyl isomerase
LASRHGLPSRLLREPLVHFVLAGAVLFAAFRIAHGPPTLADAHTIVVDRRALLAFMQYRANAFEPAAFGAALDALSDKDLRQLIDDYVEEEALYREAESLDLERNDYIMRQRMVQKIKFLLGDDADADKRADEDELRAYFTAHKDAYAIAPAVTFAHVLFDATRRGADAAKADAVQALHELNKTAARFNDAPKRGDRFTFATNYVERTFDYVAGQFGEEFAAALAKLTPSERWQGPIASVYGEHVVLLTQRTEQRYPQLDEVRDQVEADYLRDRAAARLAKNVAAVRKRYRVEVLPLRARGAP